VQALLTVSAVGVALFGILTFDYAQQVFMNLVKSMPSSVADTPIGQLNSATPFAFYRATNALFCAAIAVFQIITIY